VTRNGRTVGVIVAAEEFEQRHRNLAVFFAASLFRTSQLTVRRLQDRPRKVDL
jgi:hypothetical protein